MAGRDAFEQLIQYLRLGAEGEQGVVIWKWSRFARDIDDAQYYSADIRRMGFAIVSLQDNVPSGPEGRIIESILHYTNQRYLIDLASDVARGQKYLAAVHRAFPLGKVPTGLKRVPLEIGKRRDGKPHIVSRLEPDPATASLVLQAYELRAAGATYQEIHNATRLFHSKPSYSKMLRHQIYIGLFTYQDLTIDDFCPPIIPLALWQAVQRINADWESRRLNSRRQTSRFLLSGLLYCQVCGHPMTGKTTHAPRWPTSRFDYYRCTRSSEIVDRCPARMIPKTVVEARALDTLCEYVQRPDVLEDVYAEAIQLAQAASQEVDPALARARVDLARLETEIANILGAIKAAGHSQVLLNEMVAMEKRQGELKAQISGLESRRKTAHIDISRPEVMGIGVELADRLRALEGRPLQQLLRSFVSRITARRDGDALLGEIVFSLLDSAISLPL
jgi:DNA invertase Pin-like site-specific DNA recombinase